MSEVHGWRKSTRSHPSGNCVEVGHVVGWRKSRFSHPNGDCVEVGHVVGWRKSRFSHPNGDCVEVGRVSDHAAVRDSKSPETGHFTASPAQWRAFIDAVKDDRFSI